MWDGIRQSEVKGHPRPKLVLHPQVQTRHEEDVGSPPHVFKFAIDCLNRPSFIFEKLETLGSANRTQLAFLCSCIYIHIYINVMSKEVFNIQGWGVQHWGKGSAQVLTTITSAVASSRLLGIRGMDLQSAVAKRCVAVCDTQSTASFMSAQPRGSPRSMFKKEPLPGGTSYSLLVLNREWGMDQLQSFGIIECWTSPDEEASIMCFGERLKEFQSNDARPS